MNLANFFICSEEQVNCVCICYVVRQSHEKDKYNKLKKQLVIPLPYTVIQPGTMMIKARNTAIARATMLGIGKHKSGTHLAHVLVISICKTQTTGFSETLLIDGRVRRITDSCQHSIYDNQNADDEVHNRKRDSQGRPHCKRRHVDYVKGEEIVEENYVCDYLLRVGWPGPAISTHAFRNNYLWDCFNVWLLRI